MSARLEKVLTIGRRLVSLMPRLIAGDFMPLIGVAAFARPIGYVDNLSWSYLLLLV